MSKYLIINADDFGLCKSSNDAVIDLFKRGRLRSSTIMMPCAAAEDAVKFAVENPQYPIGVHLTMTNEWDNYHWKPLTEGKTLVNDKGYMWRSSKEVEKNADMKEIRAEIRAQVDKAHSLGMKPSHLDNHMGSLYGHYSGRFSLLKNTLKICGDYGYAYRIFSKADKRICPRGTPYAVFRILPILTNMWAKRYNVIIPDYLLFPDWGEPELKSSYEHYRERMLELWTNIPDGVTETFLHPAFETEELKGIVRGWRDRVWEYEIMKDPETEKFLNDHGVELISYRELIEMKSQKK